ncbi:MAG: hypothetical protein D3908_05795, partial [Candidatus Electrothrix sp. AUS4]|nr:hypothetical protein [Candidatus Electrothrix sp. AUS4]
MSFQNTLFRVPLLLFFCCSWLPDNVAAAETDPAFQAWLKAFYPRAAQQGISRDLYQRAFAKVRAPDSEVLRKAAYQPEFTTEIWDYLDTVVNKLTVAEGRG